MIVLSLFDGIGCGYEALKRAGINVTKYYSSEIDKTAMKIASINHEDIIHLGDVKSWTEWDIEKPDLIMGGSPCQGFSFAGKELAFDDPRSRLFLDMVNIINYYNPKYRLLENTQMKKKVMDVITKCMGVSPIEINSALVSAQNRKRNYWMNWDVTQPIDRNISFSDIADDLEYPYPANITGRRINSEGVREDNNKNVPVNQCLQVRPNKDKVGCLTTVSKDNVISKIGPGRYLNAYSDEMRMKWRNMSVREMELAQTLPENYIKGVAFNKAVSLIGNGWTIDVIAHLFEQSPFAKGE